MYRFLQREETVPSSTRSIVCACVRTVLKIYSKYPYNQD